MGSDGRRQKTIPAFNVSEELHAAISQLAERNTRTVTLKVTALMKSGMRAEKDFDSRLAAIEAIVHGRDTEKIR
jgi:hypothetical protein